MVAHYNDRGEPTYGVQVEAAVDFNTYQVGVTADVAMQIIDSRKARSAVTFYNDGDQMVFLGKADVTVNTGMPIPAGGSITVNTQAAIFGISSSGTQNVGVWETF